MSTTATRNTGEDGFFGTVLSGLGSGLGKAAETLAPIWAAQQLDVQSDDQLRQIDFDRARAQQRNQDFLETTTGTATTGDFRAKPVGFFENINVSAAGLTLVVVAIVGGIAVAKFA